jgi:hypothetical protein
MVFLIEKKDNETIANLQLDRSYSLTGVDFSPQKESITVFRDAP